MVYGHFNTTVDFLPSPDEILFGIIQAQIYNFMEDEDLAIMENYIPIIEFHVEIWKKLLELPKVVEMNKPLTP